MCYTQENIIFCSIYAFFDEELFFKWTDSYTKECKLYNKLLDKISPETELSVSDFSGKDRLAPVSILHISIPPIQNNLPTYSSLPSLFYKFTFLSPTPRSKKLKVEVEKDNNINSDIEMQPLSSQQSLQPAL